MSTATRTADEVAATSRTGRNGMASRLRTGTRRSVPHLALGLLLVVACATGFAVVTSQLDDRVPVLALTEPVTVGQLLQPSDLREVMVAADPGLGMVPSSEAGSAVGAAMSVSVPAGTLLTSSMLGDPATPAPGEAIVAVAVAPGQFPPEASPGAHVVVVPTDPDGDDPARWKAVVVGVHPTTTDNSTVVSLQVYEDEAGRLASAGAVSVVMTSAGGR